jgi:hypothetical protein
MAYQFKAMGNVVKNHAIIMARHIITVKSLTQMMAAINAFAMIASYPVRVTHAIASTMGILTSMARVFPQEMAVMTVIVIKAESLVRFELVPLYA